MRTSKDSEVIVIGRVVAAVVRLGNEDGALEGSDNHWYSRRHHVRPTMCRHHKMKQNIDLKNQVKRKSNQKRKNQN